MVKFFIKDSDKEVTLGSKLEIKVPVKTPYGESVCPINVTVSQMNIDRLLYDGFIEKRDDEEEAKKNKAIEQAVDKFLDALKDLRTLLYE